MKQITSFRGKYNFLSNFYPAIVKFDDIEYSSVENAYQLAKTLNLFAREKLRLATPIQAKHISKTLIIRGDFDKLAVMEDLLRQKFSIEKLKQLLLDTGDTEIIEDNWWGR